ncbi:hypothetical protein NEUTE1DRAFT_103499 [Neurospora tetrasperma FGSC 2508]|uniref:Heterokaryon incompatibility domain-containing protein n=1 Tax=Neurospora tetrasperma (strain FGSC 2508 / ATCC MYA-4615 / P0657) TaxID=510951 RepID=F8MVV0_NEUT8|nr:uncharacterized protein NEUTE1DRAFT_103499 [Neurospora tetrasperma FGSC 2508]EGO53998.1 hypothetical protein NEUTE1DRAFT_103499 [Neurospora tetrasperma FGSC 2508]
MPIVGLLVRELAGFRNQFRPWGGDRVSSICCLQTHFIGRRDIDGNSYSNPDNSLPSPKNSPTSPTMFTYSPLSREKRETRVFRFSPPLQLGSDRISLELRHASLDDDALQYRALSYVWGDTKEKEDIDVNGEQFSVGANLHALLQMLQYHDVQSWLWADAIYIHQSDDNKKSWHVQSMYNIFKNAEFIYSWLGPGSKATDVAMNFFSDWGPRALKVGVMEELWPTHLPTEAPLESSIDVPEFIYLSKIRYYFLPEPVFEKVSTVVDASSTSDKWYDLARFLCDLLCVEGLRGTRGKSEVALAREVLLMCGGKFTPILYFEPVLEDLWKFCDGNPWFFKDILLRHSFCERFPPYLYPNKAILVRQLIRRGTKIGLGTILMAFSNETERPWYRATDPRDIVYGILGLLSHDDRRPFGYVDYKNMTWVDLFTQATRSLIEASLTSCYKDRLYTIGHCLPRPRGQPTELPSWVPDWRDHDHQAHNVLEKDRASDWLARIRDFTKLPESSDVQNIEGEDYVWRLVMRCHNESFLRGFLGDVGFPSNPEAACFIRRLMRQDYPDPRTLPDSLVRCIQVSREFMALTDIRTSKHVNESPITKFSNLNDDASRDATIIVDGQTQTRSNSVDLECLPDNNSISESDLKSFMDAKIRVLFCRSRSRNSTLFKTTKGMLGSRIGDVRPGDVVVILENAHTPSLLRPRSQDGDGNTANRGGIETTFTFGGEAYVEGIITIRYKLHVFALRSQSAEQQNWE